MSGVIMTDRRGARRPARRPCSRNILVAILLAGGTAFTAFSAAASDWGAFDIANQLIEPDEKRKFTMLGARTFEGSFIDFAIYAAQGRQPGPTLCVTAGIHGDEINSVEIARRAFAGVDAAALHGTLVVLPAVNSSGFRTMNRYMPDRRDLNRAFPGSPDGSVASILADVVFSGVIRRCTHLVDLHTGSNLRTNVPQIRVDTDSAEARAFAVGIIVSGAGTSGTLRREAMRAGIPAIIYESGPPYVFVEPDILRKACATSWATSA